MLVWSKFITWSYWALILFHIDPNQETDDFFAWEWIYQNHGKLQAILNSSYFSKQTNIKTPATSESNEICGGKMYFFSWQPPLSCRLSELNSSPDRLWLYCRVCLQTKSVSGHPQPARTSRAPPCLLPGTLAWPDTSCLSWACVSPGCQQRAECHGTKTSGSSLGHGSSLTPKTRWRVEKPLCNIYVSVYFSGGQLARAWQVCW